MKYKFNKHLKRAGAWTKNTVRGKIINLENPGSNIEANVNGVPIIFPDSKVCEVPKAVIAALEDAVTYVYKNDEMVDLTEKQTHTKVPRRLYHFFPEPVQASEGNTPEIPEPTVIDPPVVDPITQGVHDMRREDEGIGEDRGGDDFLSRAFGQ